MAAFVRYCPDCGEEYQPQMTECIDCGSALKEKLEGAVSELNPPPEIEPTLPPGDYGVVADTLSAATVEPLVKQFVGARIPVKVGTVGNGLCLSCRAEDRAAVIAILEREGIIPAQPDAAAPPVTVEGGPCPACGTRVAPGAWQCSECGLQLGGACCDSCGEELTPNADVCQSCGQVLR